MLQGRRPRWPKVAGLGALIVVLTVLFASVAAAQTGGLTVQISGMTGDQWPQAQGVLSVLGNDGRTVPGLAAENFHATLNGSDVPIVSVAQGENSSQPIDVVLVMDVSGSMQGAPIDQAKVAAHSFLDQLRPQDRVAIVAFGTTVTPALGFTTDRAAAQAAIDGLTADGTTALFEATKASVILASSAQNARRAVVLLSDGGIGVLGAAITRDEAIATAQTGAVPIFAIGLGNQLDRAYLQELADKTGGQFVETPTPEGLAALYQKVGELLRGQYILTLDASALKIERSEPATLRIEVTQADLTGENERAVCAQNVCVALGGIQEGQRLEAQSTVHAQVVASEPVTSVSLLIDGKSVTTLNAPPYEFTVDAATLADGNHKLVAQAATASDSASSAEVGVRIGAAASSSSSMTSGLVPVAAIAGIAFVAILLVLFVVRRRRRRGPRTVPASPEPPAPAPPPSAGVELRPRERTSRRIWDDEPQQVQPQAAPQRMLGSLRVTGGELPEQTVPIGGAPISIGTGHRCLIRLPEAGFEEIATEHARVWIKEDQLVVHELRRLTAFGPAGGRWEFLAAGDTFAVGPYTFTFLLVNEMSPAGANATPAPAAMQPAAVPSPYAEPAPAAMQAAASPYAEPAPAAMQQAAVPPPVAEPAPIQPPAPPPAPEPVVPNILRDHPAEALPASTPSEPEVPNILRDRPAEAPAAAQAAPQPEVPNILRDRPAEALPASTPSQPEAPNILRDRLPADAGAPPALTSTDPPAPPAPPSQADDESAA